MYGKCLHNELNNRKIDSHVNKRKDKLTWNDLNDNFRCDLFNFVPCFVQDEQRGGEFAFFFLFSPQGIPMTQLYLQIFNSDNDVLIIPRYRYGWNMALLPSVVLLLIPVNLFYIRWPVYISLAAVCAQVEKYLLTVWFVSVAMFLISGSFLYDRQRMFLSWTFSPLTQLNAGFVL